MPKIKASQIISFPEKKEPVKVHTITHRERLTDHEGLQVIADDDGQILTDMELLAHFRHVRSQIGQSLVICKVNIIGFLCFST